MPKGRLRKSKVKAVDEHDVRAFAAAVFNSGESYERKIETPQVRQKAKGRRKKDRQEDALCVERHGWALPAVDYQALPHRDRCFRVPNLEQGNNWWPLPPQYPRMSAEQQAWWRVNACCIQDSPEDFLIAFTFFTQTYLWPDDAMFYENKRPSPTLHYQIVYDVAAFRFNAIGAPRDYSKSTLARILVMFMALTRKGYRLGYIGATQSKVRECLGKLKDQFTCNPYLLNDFGQIRPTRGTRQWSNERLELDATFGSYITGMWVKGATRGGRLDFVTGDDLETDPKTNQVNPDLTEWLLKCLHKVYLPMIPLASGDLELRPHIARRGASFLLLGTIIQESMVLARILDAPSGSEYDYWNRWRIRQFDEAGNSSWGERYTAAEGELLRGVLGASIHDSEFLNQPGESSRGILCLHPVFHAYAVDDLDGNYGHQPLECNGKVRWATREKPGQFDATPVWKEFAIADWLRSLDRVIAVDFADSTRSTSDFTAMHVFGYDATYTLWSLDLVLGRFTNAEEAAHLESLVMKWLPSRLCMEAIGAYAKVVDLVMNNLRPILLSRLGWIPVPQKLTYNSRSMSKGQRIERTAWRYRLDKIRYPLYRGMQWPYCELVQQIRNFTTDLSGLRYDDAIDTTGFVPEIYRGPGGRLIRTDQKEVALIETIEKGTLHAPDGKSLLDAVPSYSMMTDKALEAAHGRQGGDSVTGMARRRIRERLGRPPRNRV